MTAIPPGITVQDGRLTLADGVTTADLRHLAYQVHCAADALDPGLLPEPPAGTTPDMVTVRFEFDFVLHHRNAGWQNGAIYGEPMPGMIDILREAVDTPHIAALVQTIRPVSTLADITDWLTGHGIPAVTDDGRQCSRDMFYTDTTAVLVTRTLRVAGATIDRALVKQGPDAVRTLIRNLKRPSDYHKSN
ncbi:hypothetical protein [Streptomyces clavuligerus]|uniref:hypothetical protein n=1 Tax=Streptomyces clavuligerus TaxID=1901 RepID=UPI0001800B2C|nr:hypothetical protein [Streptomyces clavuligerus]EDY53066.1 hypothetical protein SSCG_06044 [Streptomyces clavuligerus]WDN56017.1 hypothetical protein LL058_29475 [Streptomyces clavuligerus]